MSFLAPLFLAGALAIGLPILFHLIRQTTRERQVFSSLMFLAPTPPRLTRRSRLEHILLLVLRCSAILLLAAGFARPFFKDSVIPPQAEPDSHRTLILVDTSASLRRAGLWDQVQKQAAAILRQTHPGDEVAIYTFDRQLSPVLTFEEWNQAAPGERVPLAEDRLSVLQPVWSASRSGTALMSAAEILSENRGGVRSSVKQVVVISDLQEGGRWEAVQGFEWPRDLTVEFRPVKPSRTGNAGIQMLTDTSPPGSREPAGFRVRVVNAADSEREHFSVAWALGSEVVGPAHDVLVPRGQSRTFTLSIPEGRKIDRLRLTGDEEDFDNTAFVAVPAPARLSVLYVGPDDGNDARQPLFFLKRAFQETRQQTVQVVPHKSSTLLNTSELDKATMYMVTDVGSRENASLLRDHLTRGKTAFLAIQDAGSSEAMATLFGVPELRIQEARSKGFSMLVDVDYRHPLFAPFSDPRFADFTRIRFWRHWRLDSQEVPGARLLAKFDGGDPALLEIPIGSGRVLVLTAGWRPEDSQLALSTKFVPLLYSLLEQSGAPPAPPLQYYAGEDVPGPHTDSEGESWVVRADGSRVALNGTDHNSLRLDPGVYTLASRGATSQFAVNLDPAESRVSPISQDELERLGVPLKVTSELTAEQQAQRRARLANTEIEARQKVWRWLILAALGVLLVETWLSGRASRRIVPGAATA